MTEAEDLPVPAPVDPPTSGCGCEQPTREGARVDAVDDDGDVQEQRRLLRALLDPTTGELRPPTSCGCDVEEPERIVAPLRDWRSPAVTDADAELDWQTFADPDDVEQDP